MSVSIRQGVRCREGVHLACEMMRGVDFERRGAVMRMGSSPYLRHPPREP